MSEEDNIKQLMELAAKLKYELKLKIRYKKILKIKERINNESR